MLVAVTQLYSDEAPQSRWGSINTLCPAQRWSRPRSLRSGGTLTRVAAMFVELLIDSARSQLSSTVKRNLVLSCPIPQARYI